MFDLSQPNEADYPELVEAATRARATMTHYSQGLLDAGRLVGDPEVIARVFWASIHGLVVLKLADKLGARGGLRGASGGDKCTPRSASDSSPAAAAGA